MWPNTRGNHSLIDGIDVKWGGKVGEYCTALPRWVGCDLAEEPPTVSLCITPVQAYMVGCSCHEPLSRLYIASNSLGCYPLNYRIRPQSALKSSIKNWQKNTYLGAHTHAVMLMFEASYGNNQGRYIDDCVDRFQSRLTHGPPPKNRGILLHCVSVELLNVDTMDF